MVPETVNEAVATSKTQGTVKFVDGSPTDFKSGLCQPCTMALLMRAVCDGQQVDCHCRGLVTFR